MSTSCIGSPLANEVLLALADARDLIPRRCDAGPVPLATLRRWSSSGLRGVVLETLKAGGTRVTSREAILRFMERLAQVAAEARQ